MGITPSHLFGDLVINRIYRLLRTVGDESYMGVTAVCDVYCPKEQCPVRGVTGQKLWLEIKETHKLFIATSINQNNEKAISAG
jgi:hypothetical protein